MYDSSAVTQKVETEVEMALTDGTVINKEVIARITPIERAVDDEKIVSIM
jgi:hypothetical protein